MDLGLAGKTAVITGGSKGIGFAAARQFLLEGAKVGICARNREELEKAGRELSALGEVYTAVVDMSREGEACRFAGEVFSRFSSIDCWVNNVGASFPKTGEEYTAGDIEKISAVCFNSAVYGCQAAFRYMKKSGGSIVNISSLAARCGTTGRSTLYGPLKAAVVSLAVAFAGEYAAWGIRVNSVMPGFTLTPAVQSKIPEEELKRNAEGTLLRRIASPEEIAAPIVFLSSPRAGYITGASLEVSGGRNVTLNPSYSWEQKEKG
jgi:NAD(P)-dependent dehydrogenase (short-subunit alcohol dehydrogenase family)